MPPPQAPKIQVTALCSNLHFTNRATSIKAPVRAGALPEPEPPRRESWSVSKALSRSFRVGSFNRGSFRAGSFRIGSFRVRRPPGPSVEEARRAMLCM